MRDDNDDGDGKDSDDNNKHKINNFLSKCIYNPLMCFVFSTNMCQSLEKHDYFSPGMRCIV